MTLALPSFIAAPSVQPAVQPSTRPAARDNDADTPAAGSFGEAMSRASQSAEETSAKPADKATTKPAARRSSEPENDKDEPAEPTPVLGLILTTLDSRSAPLALGSEAAALGNQARLPATAALVGDAARMPAAAGPPGKALPSAFLAAEDAGLLADAAIDMTARAETAQAIALAALGTRDRGQSLAGARKETALPIEASERAQTAVPRMALETQTNESPALPSPEQPAAGGPENKAATANKTVLATGSETQARFEALIASMSSSGFTEPALAERTGSEASALTPGFSMTGVAAPGQTNIGSPAVAPTAASPVLPQDVGSSEWSKALGKHMLHMGQAGQDTAVLQLNPPGLGPLKITLSMNDQQIQAAFISTHPQVRAAIEAALPQLRAAMADGGLSLGEASVGSDSRQPADAGQGQEGRPGQRNYPGSSMRELASGAGPVATEPSRQIDRAGVDTYA